MTTPGSGIRAAIEMIDGPPPPISELIAWLLLYGLACAIVVVAVVSWRRAVGATTPEACGKPILLIKRLGIAALFIAAMQSVSGFETGCQAVISAGGHPNPAEMAGVLLASTRPLLFGLAVCFASLLAAWIVEYVGHRRSAAAIAK